MMIVVFSLTIHASGRYSATFVAGMVAGIVSIVFAILIARTSGDSGRASLDGEAPDLGPPQDSPEVAGGPVALSRAAIPLAAGVALTGCCSLAAGLTSALAPEVRLPDMVPLPAEIPNVGLFFVVGAFLSGVFLVPGAPMTLAVRIRRVLDGLGVGICGFFVARILLWSRLEILGAALTAVLLACVAVGTTIAAGARLLRCHPAGVLTLAGIVMCVTGQAGMTVGIDYDIGRAWAGGPFMVLVSAGLLTVGSLSIWLGFRSIARSRARTVRVDVGLAGYPVLALPLAGSLITALYHFLEDGAFDALSVGLCAAGVAVVAVRETLGALDIRLYASRLATQEARFKSLYSGSTDVALMLGGDLTVRWQSPAAARLLGLSDQEVVGKPFGSLLHEDAALTATNLVNRVALPTASSDGDGGGDAVFGEVRLRDGFGGWREVELRVTDHRDDPALAALVVHVRDVGDRKALERSLQRATRVDELTALPNRRELSRTLTRQPRRGVAIVLCLDRVTGVNDAHGRQVGDVVLVEAARRLREAISGTDVAARLDGDHFAVITESGAMQAQLLATRLLTILMTPYATPVATTTVGARAGLAELWHDDTGCDLDETLRRAELALRRAKRSGRGWAGEAVEWHDVSMEAEVRRQVVIEQFLPEAVENGALELRYQPIIDLSDDHPVGVEAILSTRHPELGTVPAAELLRIAKELGLAETIVEWGLRRACRQLAGWRRDGHDPWLSIDVPASQTASPAFVATVMASLEAHQVPSNRLMIEIAETGLNAGGPGSGGLHAAGVDAQVQSIVANLGELRSLGVRVAVDHFGTASTSLSHLRVLPVDVLKVDRQLFADSTAASTSAIIDVVVRFGKQLGVEVTAQGLESAGDLAVVRAAGCQYGQGDLLSRPVPAEYLEAFLDSRRIHRF